MKIKPGELAENNYVLLEQLAHHELVPFIQTYIRKRTMYSVIYYLCNLLLLVLTGYFILDGYNLAGYNVGDRLTDFSYGIAIAFALVPLHEYIHVLAYKSQGAVNTSYAANLKKFYFMALADKFVADKKEFEVVALAPFVAITAMFSLLLCVAGEPWTLIITGILLAHTAMCSGDFGLLSYFACHRDKQVVTFDDVAGKTSYFYVRSNETKNGMIHNH
ncbi:MAG: DUF3267 domain-containing protein [Chitinophagales bacterium]|nr:DUF3267 domain-containing protein [Chitinophagales bacterium]